MTRESLESEIDRIVDGYKDMSERGLSDYGLKQALLKTVDRYVEEQESELAKNILRQADYMVKDGELVHAVATEDIKSVVPSLSALRQQVKEDINE